MSNGDGRITSTRDAIGFMSDMGSAIATISMLATFAVGAATTVVGLGSNRPGAVLFGSGMALGIVIGGACTLVVVARRAGSIEGQRGYRWVDATYRYEISPDDDHHHVQTAEIVIRAARNGVRTFSNQYRWSGSGVDDGPAVTSAGHFRSGPIRRSLGWRQYDVLLDPPLRKGETTRVVLVQELHDDDELFDPYLAKTVHEPMKTLTLQVRLPPHLAPDGVWLGTRKGVGPEAPENDRSQPEVTTNGSGTTITFVKKKPTVGLSYALNWGYEDNKSIYELSRTRLPGGGQPKR